MKCIIHTVLLTAYLVLFQGVAHSDQLPGEFAIRSIYGNFVTAVGAGGQTADAIHSDLKDISRVGSWEKFKLYFAPAHHRIYTIQTMRNYLLTAVDGGGRTAEPVFQTDRTYVQAWEQFNLFKWGQWHLIRVSNGNYANLVNNVIHTDGDKDHIYHGLGFLFYKCGDPGPNSVYHLSWASGTNQVFPPYNWLQAYDGGGRVGGAMGVWVGNYERTYGLTFRLIRQPDGLYALQTENGVNYVTAVNGGGQGVGSRALETNRTWVLGWEKFRLNILPDCAYAFQTESGHWLGLRYADPNSSPPYGTGALTTNSTVIEEINKFRFHPADFDPLPGSHAGPPGGISGGGTPVPPP